MLCKTASHTSTHPDNRRCRRRCPHHWRYLSYESLSCNQYDLDLTSPITLSHKTSKYLAKLTTLNASTSPRCNQTSTVDVLHFSHLSMA